jgi:hypothetical protein
MFGLAALAAVAAMAFIGASSASAGDTQLCKVHTGLLCPGGAQATTEVHMVNSGVGKLLSSLGTVLCLNVLALATPLGLASPQSVHSLETSYTNCGRNSTHTNCTVTVEEEPLFDLLKDGLDHGWLKGVSGLTRVECSGFPSLNCLYDTTGIEFLVGEQKLVAEETSVEFVEGSFFCPKESTLDGTLLPLEKTYVLS